MTHSRTTVHCGAQMRAIVLFRAVYTHLSLEHPFDKILLALGDGEVDHYMTPKPPSTGHNSDCPVADNMHVRIRSVHRGGQAIALLFCPITPARAVVRSSRITTVPGSRPCAARMLYWRAAKRITSAGVLPIVETIAAIAGPRTAYPWGGPDTNRGA
jgi:hypothetical protein